VIAGHSVIEFGNPRAFWRIGDLDPFAAESSVTQIDERITNPTVLTYAAHSEKFRSARPSFTCDASIHETGAMCEYHGQTIRNEWQSLHGRVRGKG